MSLRATTDHIDDYGREHLFEIYDDQWGGSVTALKNTGRGFGQFSHQVLDPKKPWENPIQKGVLELSVWLTSTSLLDDIKDGDEQQFHIIHKIDATQEWAGYIYNDLTTYEENILPFRVTLVAKDFTDLGGKDFLVSSALPDNRETVITTIATLLNEVGFDIPIKTHTSWIEASITSSQDYLRQIYHETKALREFGRTGDESDTAITVEDALTKLCSNHKLILKQTGGAYWIDQLSEYDNPASVQETVYDIDGTLNTAESNVDTTVSANTTDLKVVISSDNRDNSGLPGLKRAKVKFDHRTQVNNISFEEVFNLVGSNSTTESQLFLSDGDQQFKFAIAWIDADFTGGPFNNVHADYRISIDAGATTYYWNNDDLQWQTSDYINEVSLTQALGTSGGRGSVELTTSDVPSAADGNLVIEIFGAVGTNIDTQTVTGADNTRFENTTFQIFNAIADENSTSIDYVLTQSGNFSVVESYQDDWYGDGPLGYSPGALRHGSGDGDTTSDSWGRRGQTADKNFHENQLKEPMDLRRGWRRLLTALLKGLYYPHNVLSYDSEFFYYLGGRWDLFTGNWQADLFSLDIVTGSDTFEDIPKFTDETGSGTGSTGGGSTGGGLDQSTADARYFRQSQLLSEATDLPTLRGNIGLADGSADLDLNSLDINGSTFVDSSRNVSAGEATFEKSGNLVFNIQSEAGSGGQADFNLYSEDGSRFRILRNNSLLTFDSADTINFQYNQTGSVAFWDNVSDVGQVMQIGNSNFVDYARNITARSITINSQPLFSLGNEQELSTDASPTFAGGTILANGGQPFRIEHSGASGGIQARIIAGNNNYWNFGVNASDEFIFNYNGSGDRAKITSGGTLQVGVSSGIFTTLGTNDLKFNRASPSYIWQNGIGGSLQFRLSDSSAGDVTPLKIFTDRVEIDGDVEGDGFTEGWDGTNWQITESGDAELESLRVRGALRVYEFIAKQLSSIGGTEILSIANGRIESVNAGSNEITVDNVDGSANTSFKADDLWIVQVVDVNNDLESGGTGSIVKQVRGSVTSVAGAVLTVSVDAGSTDGLADLEQGDLIVAYGSSSDADRQAIMYRNVDRSEDNLIMRLQTGVDAFADLTAEANTAVAYGDLNGYLGISSEEFGFFAGSQSGNYILATENQVEAVLDDINLDVVGGGSSGYGNADFFLDAGSHQLSLGDVFQADGGASTGMLAGINFDNAKLYTGDGTNGYVGLGATSGATDRAFWAGAANQDGSGAAGMYITQAGSMIVDTGSEITNTDTDFTITEDGITLWNDTAGQPTGATLKFKSSTDTNLEIYSAAGGTSFFLSRGDFGFQRNGSVRLSIQDDVIGLSVPPRVPTYTDAQRNALSPTQGWIIFNSDYDGLQVYSSSSGWINI